MSKLYETINDCQTGDPDETTAAVFAALGTPAEWVEIFWPVVRDECRRRSRSDVRDLEQGHCRHDTQHATAPRSRAAFLDRKFWDGFAWVFWGTATVDNHRNRIAFQTGLRDGIQADIDLHAKAIADILAVPGAVCLDDIGDDDIEVAA